MTEGQQQRQRCGRARKKMWALPIVTTAEKDNRAIIQLANAINAWGQKNIGEFVVLGWKIESTYGTINAMVRYAHTERNCPNFTQAVPFVGKLKSNQGWQEIAEAINRWQRQHPDHYVHDWQMVISNGTINAIAEVFGPPLDEFPLE